MRRFFWFIVASAIVLALQAAAAGASGWEVRVPGIADSAVVLGGGIAVASGDSVSLFREGSLEWAWKAEDRVREVAAGTDGSVFAAFGSSLAKLSAEGKPLWVSDTYELAYSVHVLEDGMILVGYEYGLLAFEPVRGKLLWEHYAHEECDT